jgi:hypothetical protein
MIEMFKGFERIMFIFGVKLKLRRAYVFHVQRASRSVAVHHVVMQGVLIARLRAPMPSKIDRKN